MVTLSLSATANKLFEFDHFVELEVKELTF